jgi:hypothetical protein
MYRHVIYERFMIVIFHKLHTEAPGGMDHSTQSFWHLFQHSFPVTLISKDLLNKNEVIEMRKKKGRS